MPAIRIDRSKPLAAEPRCGHNRYHPEIAPVVEVGEGEEVVIETRDALDGQITPRSTVADFANINVGAVHPLTGPVFVKGAKPGDLLEIEFVDIVAQPTAFSAIMPGLGFLRDVMTEPFLVHWQLARRLGHLRADPARAHSRRALHGRLGGGALGAKAQGVDRARAARHREGRHGAAARSRRRGAGDGRLRASPACARCRRARMAAIST